MNSKRSKTVREMYLEAERELEEQEYKAIIDRDYLSSEEIWSITERNFILWRRKHDYPRLIKAFKEQLTGFEDWMKYVNISDEFLINFGICNCINLHPGKIKKKYLTERLYDNQRSRFISFNKLDDISTRFGPNTQTHKTIMYFISYADWAQKKKINVFKNHTGYQLFRGGTMKTAYDTPNVEVSILENVPLLKIGGCKVPTDGVGGIRTKYFELVNADNLILEGRLTTQSRVLGFESSSVDNLECHELDLGLVKFSNCSVQNFHAERSNIQQWEFYESRVTGKLVDSDFAISTVFGGDFYLDFRNSKLSRSDARAAINYVNLAFEHTYREFKQLYANQGNDTKAVEYFLLEKNMQRRRFLDEIRKAYLPINYEISWTKKLLYQSRLRTWVFVKWLGSTFNEYFWGYGRRPLRIIPSSLFIISICALFIWSKAGGLDLVDAFYFSTVTFLTIGSGHFDPQGSLKILVIVEALLGVGCVGFLIGGLSNSKF